ncbi:hypothetical protein DSECCO2_192920 [anaerobic digester metagenome]
MGAFFLYQKNKPISLDRVKSVFEAKNLGNCREFDLGNHILLLYGKVLLPEPLFFSLGDHFICNVGTLVYKNKIEEEALTQFLQDFIEGSVSSNEIHGTFCIIVHTKGQLYVINDDENLYPVYVHEAFSCISSSFLALCQVSDSLSINRLSLLENLITGCSLGFDTYFNEIKRFRWGNNVFLPNDVLSRFFNKSIQRSSKRNKHSIILQQKEGLLSVFKRIAPLVNKYACEIGLSSGYDSRLLFASALHFFNKDFVHVSSNYKQKPDTDLKIARKLAEAAQKKLTEIPVISTELMSEEQFENNLRNAFLFYDGQIRVNHGWTREYRTLRYRKSVLGEAKVGLSGHGGEVFRNDYNLDSYRFSYDLWLKNKFIGKAGLKKVKLTNETKALVSYIKNKINLINGLSSSDHLWDKRKAHVFYNEIWVSSGPGIRASIENQLSYYLSPFTDYLISKHTYNLVPFLRNASFEKEMISSYCKEVSVVPYEKKGRNKLLPFLYTTLLYRFGIDIHYIIRKYFKNPDQKNENIISLQSNYPYLKKLFSNPKLGKVIPFEKYMNLSLTEPERDRLIAFAFVLFYYNEKIKL